MMFSYEEEEEEAQPQEAVESKTHTFKTRVFRNPHSCGLCKEIIWNEGRICRVCRFACHKRCEYKVMTTCLPQSPTVSPEGKYIFGSPSENRRKKSSSSPSTPTTPTPPSTPRQQRTPATPRKMQQQQPDESPKLQSVTTIMQQSTAQIQHAPPPQPQQQQLQQQQQPQPLIQHQIQPQTIQTKSTAIKSGDGLVRYSFDLEVDYITERLIAVSFPSGGLENQYRSNLRDVVRMLKSKHNNSYVVFNLSRRRHDVTKLNQEVRDLGWPNVLAPPLERLCSICKQMETWMKANLNNVVVLHCKGGRGPIGVVVSAFMNYMSITSAADSTMDRHAMKRFLDAKGWSSMHPSQMRYIDYFTGLLTNSIQINSSPLYLHHAVIHGVPNYDSNGGCRPFLRIYQGMSPVYTSGVYTVPEGTSRFVITPGRAIPLRGDILLKCYHKKFRSTTRDTVFRCQFHTTAVMEYRLVFQKQELDDACTDARFPEFTKVELIFSSTPDALHGSDYVSGASFPSEHIDDPLIRWDSYEHFNDIIEGPEDGGPDLNEMSGNNNNNMILDIPHSSAPDGSLYAQVKKTPSPEQSPVIPRLTNGDTNAASLPYVLSPEKAPQVHSARDGGKRNMDYRERMALDELLKGITGEDTDGGIVVNNNTQWKAPPSPDNKVLHHDPVHTRRIVSVSEDLRHAPVAQSKPKPPTVKEEIKEESAGQENSSPSKKPVSRKESSEAENPYAEITDAMQQKLQQNPQQNPNTNQSGPQQERITPVVLTNQEHSAPPMMNGGTSVPRSVEQHNPTYEITPKGSNHRTMQNGHVTQNGPVVQKGQVNLNPGQVNLNPGQVNVSHAHNGVHQNHGPTPVTFNQMGRNPGPAQPYVAQMNGPVETPIVPNSSSRVTERTPNLSRLENGPTSPVHPTYEPRPLKAREDRFQLLRKDPNAPQQQQYQPSPPSPAQVSPVSPTGEDEDGGLGWLKRQQDKLREKRERENGRPIVIESSAEPVRATPVSASPKLRVRFEGDVQSAPPASSPPLSTKKEETPSWLAQQQQKLQDRRGDNMTPINLAPMVATETTPVHNAMSPVHDRLLMTGPQDGGVSVRRGVSPPPLSISSDLERSISELGQMNTAQPAQTYVQRTITTTTRTNEWEPHERPLNRQLSDLTHDRVRDPVFQRPDTDPTPKVPATPSTPYDPVPPILTNSQLKNDGREEIEHWNNYGYSYNGSSMQETGPTLPGSAPTSQSFFPTSPMQQKMDGERSPVGRHFHVPESRLQQPTQTERKVRTLNKQTLHVEATNPSQSVTLNTTHPPLSSMHGTTPPLHQEGRLFTRSLSNSGLNELHETNNNNSTGEDAFSTLDDAVKMLSHWSNEIQKLSAPYQSSAIDANRNTHASLDNSATIPSHHQLNNNNQSDERINPTHFQTHQSSGGYHYTSQPLTNHRPQATSTPKKNFDEVDLHIDEPTEVDSIPKGLVADRSPTFIDRSPPAAGTRPPRRTNSQSGYDSDTGIQQYYRPPRRRNLVDPGAEVWLQNPGGLPRKESEYWNRKDGLKSPEGPKEYDLSSSSESISGSKTPKFPVGPRAYANMTKTFIVKTGAPPHGEIGKALPPVLHADYRLGPDQPLPLQRTMPRQDSFEIPPVPEPAAVPCPAPTAEVYSLPPPQPLVEPAREPQPMYSQKRVITVEHRTEPSRQPMEWTPTAPAAPGPDHRYYTPQAASPSGLGDDPLRQLEYLESEPWLGRKPILHSPPHRPNEAPEIQPWTPPVVTTTMSTTGPIHTVTNGVPQTVTTTQWRREITHQQPIEITPFTKDVTDQVEARQKRQAVESRFMPSYMREVNSAPPPPQTPPSSQAPLPRVATPPQPRVIHFQEEPLLPVKPEPPITEVRLHGVELGPIQVVPIEAQVIVERKGQYPVQDANQQGPTAPGQVPVTSQQYQAQPQPLQEHVTPPPSYGSVLARSPSPTFGVMKSSAPQVSHGAVQGSPSSVSYGKVPPASTPPSYSTVQQLTPPLSYGTVQTTPQRAVMTGPGQEPTIIQQRVEVKEITQTESIPVSHTPQQQQQQQPQQREPPLLQQNQQQVQQDVPQPEQPPMFPEQPSQTANERLLNQPKPPVQYPTFSDRHRKAAKGPVDDSLPNGGAGYRTIYDNKRHRSSLGNEGQLPSPGGLSGKSALNGNVTPPTLSGRSTPSNFYYTQKLSPYGSSSSLADPSVEHVRFVKDLSAWWYKPNISRDDAINILKDKPPGVFIVRDSNSFPGAFGLALKVAQVPANTTPRKGGDPQSELVRHFLIEPNARGVRLKGCVNEPVFSSLSALIYQHTLTQLALPIKLVLPDTGYRNSAASLDYPSGTDSTDAALDPKSAASLLQQGAACKVLYIDSVDMESLTGSEAVREGLTKTLTAKKKPEAVVVHFKVSSKGITLTDTQRKLFFRKHYPVKSILFCGMDPHARKYPRKEGQEVAEAKIFGFVARKPGSMTDNQCHLFADWEVEQPASAIVSFVTKVMLGSTSKSSVKTP